MTVYFLTIALDAFPFITHHLPIFNRLPFDWRWLIAEGVAAPVKCTKWCAPMEPRLSNDGTTEYLKSIVGDRVTLFQNLQWPGKVSMFNRMLSEIKKPAIIHQIDSDELYLPHQLENIKSVMESHRKPTRMDFRCRYFVGNDIVVTSRNTYGDNPYEWRRVWAYEPGMQFESHEPPKIRGDDKRVITKDETEEMGLVFEHYPYVTERQLMLKGRYYQYEGALPRWKKLQANQKWPARLSDFLPWVPKECIVDKLYKK